MKKLESRDGKRRDHRSRLSQQSSQGAGTCLIHRSIVLDGRSLRQTVLGGVRLHFVVSFVSFRNASGGKSTTWESGEDD